MVDLSRLLRLVGIGLVAILVAIGGGISIHEIGGREVRTASARPSAHAAGFPVLFYSSSATQNHDGGIVARGKRLRAQFEPTSVVFDGPQGQTKLKFVGTSATAMPMGEKSQGSLNILHGSDPSGWRVGMPIYSGVSYRNIYPGIDLRYHDTAGRLESDYVVAPDRSPSMIRFQYQSSKIRIKNGALTVSRQRDLLTEAPPSAFQIRNGKRVEVKAGFHVFEDGSVGFDVGAYDKSAPLVIDPVVTFSTFWGGSLDDGLTDVAVGPDGSIYVSGWTESSDVPTASAVQPNLASPTDALVMRLSASNTIIYATYLGGGEDDRANGIAVDGAGYAYVTGFTRSHDFPTLTPFQSFLAGAQNAFIAKLSPTGTALAYSTYLGGGGSDTGNAIQVDASGSAYVAGQTTSTNFPVSNAYQSTNQGIQDAFVTKLNPGGNTLAYSTYIGGSGTDAALGIAVRNGQAYITGSTDSFNFPHLNAFQAWNQGGQDAFVTALNAAGNGLVYSTYLGGGGGTPNQPEIGYGIALDAAGSAYVVGTTPSFNFPISTPIQSQLSYSNDAFITKLNPAGNTIGFSTYLGGSSYDAAMAVTLDSAGNLYVTGYTASPDFPTLSPAQAVNGGGYDAFIASIVPGGNVLRFSSYWGGAFSDSAAAIALDSKAHPVIAGQTLSLNFPLVGPLQNWNGSAFGGFITRWATGDLFINVPVNFVTQLYLDLLDRLPDPAGLSLWTNYLTSGTMSRSQVAQAIFQSPECRVNGVFIIESYLALLNRDPDFAGWLMYYQELPSLGQTRILDQILNSPEFVQKHPGLSDQAFVTLLYNNALLRAPDPAGLNLWTSQLSGGTITRAQLAFTIISSPESFALNSNHALVDLLYLGFLRRGPDPAGLAGWKGALDSGVPLANLINGFITSPEYIARF